LLTNNNLNISIERERPRDEDTKIFMQTIRTIFLQNFTIDQKHTAVLRLISRFSPFLNMQYTVEKVLICEDKQIKLEVIDHISQKLHHF